jgi:ferredoxin
MAAIHGQYREAGRVHIDEDTCTQCGQCATICPTEVLRLEDGQVRIRADSPLGCIACGHCMTVCPEGSIAVSGRGISPEDLLPLPPVEERATSISSAHWRRCMWAADGRAKTFSSTGRRPSWSFTIRPTPIPPMRRSP